MNISKRTIGAVALAAAAVVGYGDDDIIVDGVEEEVEGTGAIVQCALDLSDVWDKRDVKDEPILWSSLGWEDAAEEESGKTVTLRLIPRSAGEALTLMEAQTGFRQTFTWTPGEVTKQVYNIRHVVGNGSPLEKDLNAYFSFEHYDHVAPSEADVRAAIRSDDGTGWNFGIVNDLKNWWNLAAARARGVRFGRPKRKLPPQFAECAARFHRGEITLKTAAALCAMPESTFRDKMNEKERHLTDFRFF